MPDSTATQELVKSTNRSVVLSALLMVAGVLALCLPLIAHVAVASVLGWLLVVAAVLHLAFAWRAREGTLFWEVILAFVFEAAGVT